MVIVSKTQTAKPAEGGEYSSFDQERWLPEIHHSQRSNFARDRARLLHSSAWRRLGAKTQVLSPTAGYDFARTRLTHSLEVAQIGRELALQLNLNPDLVDLACLAHDLGHPPFGHNGESALNEWADDIGGFEGNAQTLRVLSRLEPKVLTESGESCGLNLTRASLDASCKYPWAKAAVAVSTQRLKFGYYDDDQPVFEWLRRNAPQGRVCMEAQVMDFSDDVAYSVHDFEDAIVNGHLQIADLNADIHNSSLIETVARWAGNAFINTELIAAFDRLRALPVWITNWDERRASQARLKNLSSQLIGRFIRATTAQTLAENHSCRLNRFAGNLVVPRDISAEIAVLKGLVAAILMVADTRQDDYRQQRTLLIELAETLFQNGPQNLDSLHWEAWLAAQSVPAQKRVVVDQLANLTDQTALLWSARLGK